MTRSRSKHPTDELRTGNANRRWHRVVVLGVALGAAALTACGDDDESAQDRYCEAGEQLESSVSALANLDLIAEGTNGLEAAVSEVEEDIDTLDETASEAAADEVDALKQSVSDLESAITGLAGEITSDNVTTLATAIQDVGTSAQAVYATLSDCP